MIYLLGKSQLKDVQEKEGVTSLSVPKFIFLLGLLAGFLFLYLLILSIVEGVYNDTVEVVFTYAVIMALIAWGALTLFFVGLYHKVLYDDNKVVVKRFRKSREFGWDQICKIEYSALRGVYRCTLKNRQIVEFNQLLKGIFPFFEIIEERAGLDLSKYLKVYRQTKK